VSGEIGLPAYKQAAKLPGAGERGDIQEAYNKAVGLARGAISLQTIGLRVSCECRLGERGIRSTVRRLTYALGLGWALPEV